MKNFLSIAVGQRFGRLLVTACAGKANNREIIWECLCDCGNIAIIRAGNLRKGHTQSCGCLRRENVKKRRTTHGLTNTRIESIRHGMLRRCYKEKAAGYKHYGGRGITVCDEWRDSLETFASWAYSSGYKEDLTLDRIDNDGNYCPENCKWSTLKEQSKNRRNSRNVTFKGKTIPLAEWSEITGINIKTLGSRFNTYKWSDEKILSTPVQEKKLVSYKGNIRTLKEWSKILNIPYGTLRARFRRNWSIEKALTTPVRKRRVYE